LFSSSTSFPTHGKFCRGNENQASANANKALIQYHIQTQRCTDNNGSTCAIVYFGADGDNGGRNILIQWVVNWFV
jgi:hypothetical protein